MTNMRAMLERSETLARENAAADAAAHKRTEYVILTRGGFYACARLHWTNDVTKAMRFAFMTGANGYAILELDLSCDDFTVELV